MSLNGAGGENPPDKSWKASGFVDRATLLPRRNGLPTPCRDAQPGMAAHMTKDDNGTGASGQDRTLTASDEMLAETYDLLRSMASKRLNGHARSATLNTTMIVHEAWLKLSKDGRHSFADQTHYLATASRAMRQILVDHARKKLAEKRGGGTRHIDLDELQISAAAPEPAILEVEDALQALAKHFPNLERVVECRFFAGMTVNETASALNRSPRTIEREWARARVYLAEHLTERPRD